MTACFSNTKYPVTIQTHPAQIVSSVIENQVIREFSKIIGLQDQLLF